MDERVAAFLAQKQRETEEARQREREQLLIRLGLVEIIREYAPENIITLFDAGKLGYSKVENDPLPDGTSKRRFYKEVQTPIDISDEEYLQLVAAVGTQEPKEQKPAAIAEAAPLMQAAHSFLVLPGSGNPSAAARFYRILAILLWVIGVVVSFVTASKSESYYASPSFNFGTFLLSLLGFALWGMVLFTTAELFENVKRIADSFSGMTIRPDKK